ncbi:MAG: tetratricopeptide repeat protein, partial [Desulfobulbia bacterium]
YYHGQGIEDPIRIDIPKGSYIPTFLENHTASEVPGPSECPPPVPDHTPHSLSEPTIAVSMFQNLNRKDEKSFLARGLTSEILISLTRFSGLTVLGPLDQAEGKTIDLHKICNGYKAMFVLQGRVRSQGSKVRITVDLTDASTGANVWGRTFEYDLEKASLFEIEDQVTSQVTGVVADGLGIIFRKIKTDTYQEHIRFSDVTHAVLKYNHGWMTLAPQDWEQAIAALGNALKRHPDNALLTALLANLYYADVAHDSQLIPDALSKAKKLIHKAIDLDPDLQVAQYNLVPLNALLGRTEQCVAAAKKVVAMNPNHARILAGCAVAVTQSGAYDTGVDYIERAMKLNPHYPGWYHFVYYLV